jgi:diguanylate cyclase (GGDEF)-like protein
MDYVFSTYQMALRSGIDRYALGQGIRTVYFGIGDQHLDSDDAMARERLFDIIEPAAFDGILIASSTLMNVTSMDMLLKRLAGFSSLPIVYIGPCIRDEESIRIDNKTGMRELLSHMLGEHGYRDIAFVSGPFSNPDAMERLEVYRESLAEFGIEDDPRRIYEGNFRQSAGMAAVSAFFDDRGLKPEAIVCASDFMAIGAWKALRARGLLVPQDVALSGFDDLQISKKITHQITTVRQPFEEQAWQAARRLHAIASGRIDEGRPSLIPAVFKTGSSCGCLAHERRRRAGKVMTSVEGVEALSQRLGLYATAGLTGEDVNFLCRDWIRIIDLALDEKKSVTDMEEILRGFVLSGGCAEAPPITAILATFHALALEEFSQAEVFCDIYETIAMDGLRHSIDDLQAGIRSSKGASGSIAQIKAIAEKCGSKEFHVVIFDDPGKPFASSRLLYGTGADDWKPGPGSWIPERECGLAVNILAVGKELLGYLVMSSDVESVAVYNYITIRISSVFHDAILERDVREANARMTVEIQAREESQRRLEEALSRVAQLSIEDELTHLRNRRGFLDLAEQQIKLLRRQNCRYIMLFADVDGLKAVNDTYGHKEGDLAIRTAAKALQMALRDSDIIARLGGDEFTALVSGAGGENVEVIRQRIEACIEKLNNVLHRPWTLSLSLGFFCETDGSERDVAWMLDQADAELYKVKVERKNKAKK